MDNRGREMMQEGQEVRERQTILLLPDVTHMVAELKIQESDIDKVRAGQPAIVKVDALPGLVLTGHVERVSPLADSGSRWSNNNLKVYKTWITIDGENQDQLRPNMSAEVEILVGEIPDTIAVPLTAVRRQGRVHYVWKVTDAGPVATPVDVGQSTVIEVEVVEGLTAGDRIYLAPPPGAVPPQLPQPEAPEALVDVPKVAPGATPGAPPQDGAPKGDTPQADASAPAEGTPAVTRQSFQAALLQKHPEFADRIESGGPRTLFSDPEIRQAIEADTELSAMSQALREQMMKRMRERGGQGGGPGGQRGNGGGDGAGTNAGGRQRGQ